MIVVMRFGDRQKSFKDNRQKGEFVKIKNNYKSNLLFLLISYIGITSTCNAVCPDRASHQDIIVSSGTKMEAPKSETIRDGKIEVCEYIRTSSENEKTEKMFVYVLINKGKTVYCGQTNDPTRRAREHSYEEGSYPKVFDQMLAIGYFNEEDTNVGEAKCVKFLEPYYNIQLRGGSDDDIEIKRVSYGTYTGLNGIYKVAPPQKQPTKEQAQNVVTKDWFSKGYYTDEYGNIYSPQYVGFNDMSQEVWMDPNNLRGLPGRDIVVHYHPGLRPNLDAAFK